MMTTDMATIYDCSEQAELLTGMRLARVAIGRGELVVMPTDTVYGLAADAFDAKAVQRLLDAKGRTRQAPPPVLIPGIATLAALTESVPREVTALVEAFWPGGLTVILPARDTLDWDLGETNGTVALRMPNNRIVLELLSETGPLAVSSANLTGQPAAQTAQEAERMLGESVAVYLDGGEVGSAYGDAGLGSTIVDATGLFTAGGAIRIVRHGVISDEAIEAVLAAMPEEHVSDPAEHPLDEGDVDPGAIDPDAIDPGAIDPNETDPDSIDRYATTSTVDFAGQKPSALWPPVEPTSADESSADGTSADESSADGTSADESSADGTSADETSAVPQKTSATEPPTSAPPRPPSSGQSS